MFDAKRFLDDHDIESFDHGKNVTSGWVNIRCPFCLDSSNHGGFDPHNGYYNCWNCDHHFLDQVISKLTGKNIFKSKEIIKKYSTDIEVDQKEYTPPGSISLPIGSAEIKKTHRKYLEKRNYDPDLIKRKYKIMGTTQIGSYKFRIIIPLFYKGKLVSYQSRDITGVSEARYKACMKIKEIIHYKKLLYGIEFIKRDTFIMVEGILDQWRLGDGSIAIMGLKLTKDQLLQLANYKRGFILCDRGAEERAEKMQWEFSMVGVDIYVVYIDDYDDPGSMKQSDANLLMKELLR